MKTETERMKERKKSKKGQKDVKKLRCFNKLSSSFNGVWRAYSQCNWIDCRRHCRLQFF